MFTKKFWIQAAERALKTSAQFAVMATGTNYMGWSWFDGKQTLIASGVAGVVSLLTSVATANIGQKDDPSVV